MTGPVTTANVAGPLRPAKVTQPLSAKAHPVHKAAAKAAATAQAAARKK